MYSLNKKTILLFFACVLSIYTAGIFYLAHLGQTTFNKVVLFNPDITTIPFSLGLVYFLVILSGWALIYLLPGLTWYLAFLKRAPSFGVVDFVKSFLLSVILLAFGTSLFKMATQAALNRANFVLIIASMVLLGILVLYRHNNIRKIRREFKIRFKKQDFIFLISGIAFFLLLIYFFRRKIFIEDFSECGIESFYPAVFLKKFFVLYCDLEADNKFGMPATSPFWTISFLNLFNILLFGESEAAVRLHFFVYLFMLFIFLNKFIQKKNISNAILLILGFFLYLIVTFFYVGHNAYFEDIAGNVTQPLFNLLLYSSIYFLLRKDLNFFLLTSLLLTLTLWSGIILIPIILFAHRIYFREDRDFFKEAFLGFAAMILLLGSIYFIYGQLKGYLGIWYSAIRTEYLGEMLFTTSAYRYKVVFLGYLFIISGILPILTLLFLKSKDKIVIFFSLASLLYLFIVFKSSYINLHYFSPVIFLLLISFLRLTDYFKGKISFILKAPLCIIICVTIFLSWPRQILLHTANRQIGKGTQMLFSSFEQAYANRNITDLDFKDNMYFKHYIDIETLPFYADISPNAKEGYLYYVTDTQDSPLSDLILLGRDDSRKIYLFTADLDKHAQLNNEYKKIPSREDISAPLFLELFRRNRSFDNIERNYFYY